MATLKSILAYWDRVVNDKWLRGRFETISGRCYRRIRKGCRFCIFLCNVLDKIDPMHCFKAYHSDRKINPNLPD